MTVWSDAVILLVLAREPSVLAQIGIPLLFVVIGVIVTWFWRYRSHVEEAAKERERRISALEKTLAVVETQVSPMWAAVQSRIVKDLIHPSPQFREMDNLLHSLVSGQITDDERDRLGVLLEEHIVSDDPEVSVDEKETAMHTKWIMRKVVDEARALIAEMHRNGNNSNR